MTSLSETMTNNPYTDSLIRAGVPEQYHSRFARNGLGGLAEKLGIVFETMGPDLMVAKFPVEGNEQPFGLLDGGAHLVLAETLGSVASGLAGGEGKQPMGVDINATHQRAASSGWVTGTCTPIHVGRTLCIHEVVMTDDAGRRLSTARITNLLVDRR
ncbi:hotdog fold thioesterase [Rothia uropygioeca]|uniref:hotdog fold thioesterase n=1 Tax=Kocuria sp. 257 TaxID=2021970 RepID=UPI00342692A1